MPLRIHTDGSAIIECDRADCTTTTCAPGPNGNFMLGRAGLTDGLRWYCSRHAQGYRERHTPQPILAVGEED